MKILISTGEVSGDVAGALVAQELFLRRPGARIFGLGGARLEAAGVDLELSTIHLGTVGVSESIAAIPGLFRAIARIRRRVSVERPDAAILIGNDIFNVILGRWLRAKGIPVISWFPPQVWIWRSLAWLFGKSFDVVLTSFRDEQRVYEKHCRETTFVGHYLADSLTRVSAEERSATRAKFGIASGISVVAILPGSRRQEIHALTRPFLDAAALLAGRRSVRFLLPVSDPCFGEQIRAEIGKRTLQSQSLIVEGQSHDVMRAADVLLTASGTASLEATLLGVPMVVAYRVSAVTLFIVRMAIRAGLMDSETTALPNLILGRRAVAELKQEDIEPQRLAGEVEALLDDGFGRRKMLRDLAEAAGNLRAKDSSAVRVVDQVVDQLVARTLRRSDPRRRAGMREDLEESVHEN